MKRYVLHNKKTGQFKGSGQSHYASSWVDTLDRAKVYSNKGGATNAIPYKADRADYDFLPVELTLVAA
ncbi:hypothetical protein [Caulobacter sp.]|uniref:hypothetical protein n=1 Tax=Caulobacter sp. TaxID=78 RepID=UPI0031DD32F4